ncbi:hypothetical protein ILYODFUR_029683 [Ilyodon furcidens]|uniref:Uncharacterized protein n=1 Tax=Ilyodon furcidens TaxID=33524 RepID=A0ABV0V909_9TELE
MCIASSRFCTLRHHQCRYHHQLLQPRHQIKKSHIRMAGCQANMSRWKDNISDKKIDHPYLQSSNCPFKMNIAPQTGRWRGT